MAQANCPLIIACLLLIGNAAVSAAPRSSPLSLRQGETRLLIRQGLVRAAIADPSIVAVESLDDGSGLSLRAKKAGHTALTISGENGEETIHLLVRPHQPHQILEEVRAFLGRRPGLSVRLAAQQVLIEGQALRGEDLARARQAEKTFPRTRCLARLHPDLRPLVAAAIQRDLTLIGLGGLAVSSAGEKSYLSGGVADKATRDKALAIARRHDPDIGDLLELGYQVAPLVLTDLKIMEVASEATLDFGPRWDDQMRLSASAAISSGSRNGVFTADTFGAFVKLLKARGLGRILANPRLVSRSGAVGRFLVGGEIPIRVVGERTAEVIFKSYGIQLEVTPAISPGGLIGLTLKSEISSLDEARQVEGIPALVKKNLETAVHLKDGETLAVAGLLDQRAGKAIEKVPLLGEIPVLGELFKSRRFRDSRSELVLFLSPTIVSPEHRQNVEQLQQIERSFQEMGRNLDLKMAD